MLGEAGVTVMEISVFGGGGGADVPPPEHPVSRMTLSRTIPKVPKTKARPIRSPNQRIRSSLQVPRQESIVQQSAHSTASPSANDRSPATKSQSLPSETLPRSTVIEAFGRVNVVCEFADMVRAIGGPSGSG